MQCIHPRRIINSSTAPLGILAPCGKCLPCLIRQRTEWAMRMTHELDYWDSSVFLTLTYDDDHLPCPPTVSKDELQRFFKRLRKNLDHPIKYFACGEYGGKFGRPHYHAVVFGLRPDLDRAAIKAAWSKCDWSNGAIAQGSIKAVIPNRIAYCVKYVNKRYFGPLAYEQYWSKGLIPPFRLVSSGLGARWAQDNKDLLARMQCIIGMDGVHHSIPRYYVTKLDLDITAAKDRAYHTDAALIERETGIYCSYTEYFSRVCDPWPVQRRHMEHLHALKLQSAADCQARINLKNP